MQFEQAGEGPPLLLIHGTGADLSSWDPVFSLLARERRVIRYTREATKSGPYYRGQADDAAQLLSQLGIPSASICGWSAGGIVALALAVHHPGLVGKLFLYEPPLWARRYMPLSMALRFLQMMFWHALKRDDRAVEVFAKMALGDSFAHTFDEKMRAQMLAHVDTLFAELKSGTGEELTPDQIEAIQCPTALLVGGKTAPFLQKAADRLFALAPAWTPLRVADADHLFVNSQPQRFTDLVLQYG
jgi:pimeloyl-ACP methyl ester carboxylesterase